MVSLTIDQDNGTFHIQNADGNDAITICEGYFACDQLDSTTLIIITRIAVAPQDHEQLYDILSYIGKVFIESYTNKVFLRLPSTFDGQIDMNVLNFNEKVPSLMTVKKIDLKFVNDDMVPYGHEKYALISDKHIALNHSEELLTLMNVEAYWANSWTGTQMRNRIESASAIAVILDRTTNLACGFGRLFMVKENGDEEISTFGYLSDICVQSNYQRQGLGRMIVNSLIGAYLSSTINLKETDASLTLLCTNRGSGGAGVASQLYQKFGFEFINLIKNAVAVFGYAKALEPFGICDLKTLCFMSDRDVNPINALQGYKTLCSFPSRISNVFEKAFFQLKIDRETTTLSTDPTDNEQSSSSSEDEEIV
ncbi:unnamed protein product [Adineta steineri]|uniref:N-acetyltransferase domain-containing protein n=1 Tax=Adineta steineri TaxID=433720 RepID=A0A814A062_9BILA|nr:unnamed protein product [Adineta steineri]CAF0906032.1 unnamed protein product [Adineta steineri]CAF3924835.1 unnamed protein product [Adineta steineri]CAF3945209.1 unnamed protein product [Adineta steineri]